MSNARTAKACGTVRFVDNERWRSGSANTLRVSSRINSRRTLNSIKCEHFSWMLQVTKNAPQMAIIN